MVKTEHSSVRVLLVDDHALFRESVARFLNSEAGFDVVAHCGSGIEALQIVKSSSSVIDIILLDLDLGQETGLEFLDGLRNVKFAGKVLLVTADVSDSEVLGDSDEGDQ